MWRIVKRYVDSSTRHCATTWSVARRLLHPVETAYEHRDAPVACAPLESFAEKNTVPCKDRPIQSINPKDFGGCKGYQHSCVSATTSFSLCTLLVDRITLDHSRSAKFKPPLREALDQKLSLEDRQGRYHNVTVPRECRPTSNRAEA